MSKCKLCHEDVKLMNSHIIPEFMYLNIYDANPRRFYEIRSKKKNIESRIEQKGKREKMLCGQCETKISKYEKYADENLYGKNENSKIICVKAEKHISGSYVLYEFENFDFHKMKIFLDSLLWRILVSELFQTPGYGKEVTEKLRLSILNEEPLGHNEFPCVINSIKKNDQELLSGIILSPLEKEAQGVPVLSVFIDGLEYNYFMADKHSSIYRTLFLQPNGSLKVICQLVSERPELLTLLRISSEHLYYLSKKEK